MFVNPTSPRATTTAKRSRKGEASRSGFKAMVPTGLRSTRNSDAASQVGSLDGLLSLQGLEDTLSERRHVVQHSESMLDTLEDLKIALLSGKLADKELNKLQDLLEGQMHRDLPPNLANAVEEITLRARVELAKRGRFN